MSKLSSIYMRAMTLAVMVSVALPAASQAHALFGDHDPNRPLLDYLWLGFGHMIGGWDHLLFIAGVVLVARRLGTAAKLISAFVAGHSLTLLVATLAGWKLNATAVDVVIALSLVYVGVQGFRGRPSDLRPIGATVFAFGLIHGLGLSTRLQDLGLPDGGLVERVLLFNVGVELGQLTALSVIVGLGTLYVRRLQLRPSAARPIFGAISAVGLVAAVITAISSAGEDTPTAPQQITAACTQKESSPPRSFESDHPSKRFFGPTEQAEEDRLDHAIGDGLVIVRYRTDLATADHRALEEFVNASKPPYVIAAPDPQQPESVKAIVAYRTLSCSKLNTTQLARFRDAWISELR